MSALPRDNLPRQCPVCAAEMLRVTDEDDIAAVAEYTCGEKRMAFRDPRKTKVTIREGSHEAPVGMQRHGESEEEEDRSMGDLFYT